MKLSCVLNYPHDQEITTVFWSKTAVTDGETPNLCLDPEYRGRVQCDSEYKDTYSLTLTSVTEADKHMYYCRFTTNRGTWTGIPGAQLDVTGRANDLSETHTHTHARTHVHTHTHTHTHVGFYGLRGLSIGVMVFILYKLYVLLPYTYPTPKLSPHRRRCISTFPQKTLSV